MTWIEIFLATAKWATALWAGVAAAAVFGFLVIGAVIAIGGLLTGADPLNRPEICADLPQVDEAMRFDG
jgi:hypothetical protein